jgi:hypothetical protein
MMPERQTHGLRSGQAVGRIPWPLGGWLFLLLRQLILLRLILLRLIHGDALRPGLLLGFGFLGEQSLVNPMVGGFQIFLTGSEIVAFHIGLFPIHEIQVGHGVVVVGAKLNRLVHKLFSDLCFWGSGSHLA